MLSHYPLRYPNRGVPNGSHSIRTWRFVFGARGLLSAVHIGSSSLFPSLTSFDPSLMSFSFSLNGFSFSHSLFQRATALRSFTWRVQFWSCKASLVWFQRYGWWKRDEWGKSLEIRKTKDEEKWEMTEGKKYNFQMMEMSFQWFCLWMNISMLLSVVKGRLPTTSKSSSCECAGLSLSLSFLYV